MNQVMTEQVLEQENRRFDGAGGVSAESHLRGFHPAFPDSQTSVVYQSRFADETSAPCHLRSHD